MRYRTIKTMTPRESKAALARSTFLNGRARMYAGNVLQHLWRHDPAPLKVTQEDLTVYGMDLLRKIANELAMYRVLLVIEDGRLMATHHKQLFPTPEGDGYAQT
jgi:hypothetical protein